MTNTPHIRPGGCAYVSPEGIVYGTDSKLRWAFELTGLSRRCLLFTLDESRVSCSRVKGPATVDQVTHAFAVWVGGQSQPALRFHPPKTLELSAVRRIVTNPAQTRIALKVGLRTLPLFVAQTQFAPILDFLRSHCPQAVIQ